MPSPNAAPSRATGAVATPPFDHAASHTPRSAEEGVLNELALEIHTWGYVSYRREEHIFWHQPFNELQVILGGDSEVRIGVETLRLRAPSVHLFSLGQETEIVNTPGLRKVHFQVRMRCGTADLLLGEKALSAPFIGDPASWWNRAVRAADARNLFLGKALLYEALAHFDAPLAALVARKRAPLEYYARFFQYVERTRVGEFSLEKVAAIYGVHRNHFSQAFKRHFGMPAKQFFTGEKIRKAKELLSQGDVRIDSVAQELGFYDAYHFSKAFKQQTGCSPRDFRERYRGGQPKP